jgi:hypothetical protein
MLIQSWNHCIDMFAVKHQCLEADVTKYLHQLCINNSSIAFFLDSCRRHVYMNDICANLEDYSHNEVATTLKDALENLDAYSLPEPPAKWKISEIEDKTEGIMHLSMGIQKAIFKFIIKWASQYKKGSTLQRRLSKNLRAVQDLKLAYCPCCPYKDDKFGGFTAKTYQSMTILSCWLYRCLLEDDLVPPKPRGLNHQPQSKWIREDNLNWMYERDIEYPSLITAPEEKQMVSRFMKMRRRPPLVNKPRVTITTAEIRILVARMYNMFRGIFCIDIAEEPARNRSTAPVMRFLGHKEDLDLKLNSKRKQPIWIAKFNFLGLL